MFHVVNLEKWERREHFKYYIEQLKCGYSITANLDVTVFKKLLENNNLKFYPSFIYCVTYNINLMPEFRMRYGENDKLIIYDIVHPSYTIFHKDDNTFSDLWSQYDNGFYKFYDNYKCDIEKYSNIKGVKIKANQPKNFYCISCVPWLSYTGYSTYTNDSNPSLMPIITYGKYHEENGKWIMPFTVTISHAVADGYHVSKLINSIQMTIDKFDTMLSKKL
ncbi:chloramphenicol acetyltransferase [Clostridium saccharobutylicum]|uniref:Chloramphenicol acetyltransferase n=1 Tax=Clostridium saccharobutylicum TaxID=169679 RepID=A0A1S8NH38_CLOSA|nr:chloramphenicol acetyltransferase [Clostridium saccharobutylicum]OOM15779.1 chloramphenicol acetyltransferase [Clostridium saccharobutylicum]